MTQTQTLIEVPDFITVRDLAAEMGVSPIDVIKELMSNGIMANINQQIDFDTASIVAEEMGFEVVAPTIEVEEGEVEESVGWRKVLAEEGTRPGATASCSDHARSCRPRQNFIT